MGFPDGSAVENSPANAGDVGLIPESGASWPTPVFLLGKSYGQSNLAGYSLWSWQETEMT